MQLAEYSAGFMTPDVGVERAVSMGGTTHPSELSFGDNVNQMTHELLRLAPATWRLAHDSNPEQQADRCGSSRARGEVRPRTGFPRWVLSPLHLPFRHSSPVGTSLGEAIKSSEAL